MDAHVPGEGQYLLHVVGEHQLVGGDHVLPGLQGLDGEGMGRFHAADQLDHGVDLRIVQDLVVIGGFQVFKPGVAQQLQDTHDLDVVPLREMLIDAGADGAQSQQSDLHGQQLLCVFQGKTRVFKIQTLYHNLARLSKEPTQGFHPINEAEYEPPPCIFPRNPL